MFMPIDPLEDKAKGLTEGTSSGGRRTGGSTRCLNVGSYNYLGFANTDPYCTQRVIESVKKYGVSTCSPRVDGGEWSGKFAKERSAAA